MLADNPRVLVVWSGRPGYVPAPTLCKNQVTVYSHHDREFPGLIDPPRKIADTQRYDLAAAVAVAGIPGPTDFDLICIGCDASENNKVHNLSAFSCPKVLMLTDTHHLDQKPISVALDYFNSEPFDAVVSLYNRDHLKWFGGKPSVKLGWHPCLTVRDIPREFKSERQPTIAFVGNWRRNHPRRKYFMEKLINDGIPFKAEKLNALGSANLYATSLLSFNCSLNNDLNMRVLEVISAGGCLLTDRLPAESGLNQLFTEDGDYIAYGSYRELKKKAEFYLSNPSLTIEIARNALAKYRANYTPDQLTTRFMEWMLDDKHPNCNFIETVSNDGPDFHRRLDIYQHALHLQLHNERVKVLAVGQRATAYAKGLGGLGRVHVNVLETTEKPDITDPGSVAASVVSSQRSKSESWAMVVVDTDQQHHLSSLNLGIVDTFIV